MRNPYYIVYVHTTPNEKKYVGITSQDPNARWKNGRGYKDNTHFHRAILKYGWDNIEHKIISTGLSKKEAVWLEKYLIAYYESANPDKGFNHTLGGDGACGRVVSIQEREAISKRMKENNPTKNMTDSWRANISKAMKGRKMGEEFCEKCSERMKENNPMKRKEVALKRSLTQTGKKMSEESKKKISEALKERVFSDDHCLKLSKAACKRQRDSKGHFIKTTK